MMSSLVQPDRATTDKRKRTTWSCVSVHKATWGSSVRAAPLATTGTRQIQGPPPDAFPATVTDTQTSAMSILVSQL